MVPSRIVPATPYVDLDRAAWYRLSESTPLPLTDADVARLRGLGDPIDLNEVDTVYRPLSRLLNLYVAANTAEGVWVYAPDGTLLGFVGVPEPPANLAWGGPDHSTLFITATTSVYRLPMRVPGQPLPNDESL